VRKLAWRGLVAAVIAATAAGCTTSYFRVEDAPASFGKGLADPRLSLMQAFGPPLSPIVRNLRAPHGKLFRFSEVEAMLRADLEPLDIVLVRSRPAMTRLFIPSHFTHAMIWLGTERDLKTRGLWSSSALQPHQASIRSGLTILESSKSSVHLSPFDEMIDVDEILVLSLRPRGPLSTKYAALFERLGTPFDVAFDLSDATRLTCAELIAEVFPELKLPVRYAAGRLAIIPDDLARIALNRSPHLALKRYIRAEAGGFAVSTVADVRSRLTSPRLRQK
jgi:hypothetical protein